MAAATVTFTDKVDYQINPLADIYKVMAADMNAMKAAINNHAALLDAARKPLVVWIQTSDFTGSFYANADLVGLTTADFLLYTNGGSGALLSGVATSTPGSPDFAFSSSLGRITVTADNYMLLIFKPL
jgi:hypothetical protein